MTTISIVTPSFNQGLFIKATINAILKQNFQSLEYVIIDGGSTDDTVNIIKEYESRLHYWVSEPDGGQYSAINKGFTHTNGDIMAWLNSDDLYMPWAFQTVATIFDKFPEIEWLTTSMPAGVDACGNVIKVIPVYGFTKGGFFAGDNLIEAGTNGICFIQQESTFWRRSLWERTGGYVDEGLKYAADFELWARFFQNATLYAVDIPLGCFRRHDNQKTSYAFNDYLDEARRIFLKYGGKRQKPSVQRARLKLRSCLPSAICNSAFRYGLMEPAYLVTYDWGLCDWIIVRS